MPIIVGVHGIGQQFKGQDVLEAEWLPALRAGVRLAGVVLDQAGDLLACPAYGDLFRPRGKKAVGIPPYDFSDIADDWEKALLELSWRAAAEAEDEVPAPETRSKLRTPEFVQRALNALSRSRFLAGIAENAFIYDLKQVRSYLHDPETRRKVREPVEAAVDSKTRVMIGHSLGSVVAYEVLCAHPEWPVRTLVTLGSPLGIPNLIFDLLEPPPREGLGAWPGSVQRWVNVADGGDIVALVKELRPLFGEGVEDHRIYNGATAHSILPYLTAKETGDAIPAGLR
jgi:hypothetical protein